MSEAFPSRRRDARPAPRSGKSYDRCNSMKDNAPRLRDFETFFEGIVPSIIATSSADGIPNVSYLSHVVLVDDEHVGLSNQFFNTTTVNLSGNPQAAILLVDGARGGQCRLRAVYEKTVFEGPLFSRL